MNTFLAPLALAFLPFALGDDPAAGATTTRPASPAAGTAAVGAAARIDGAKLHAHVATLADDSFEGRATGTPGAAKAREYLVARFTEIGLAHFGESYLQPFDVKVRRRVRSTTAETTTEEKKEGVNVVGRIVGAKHPDRCIVLSAHYDHLGTRNGEVYNGADDNASGVAALLEIARWLAAHPPAHTIVFAAFDSEESGLQGAHSFVAHPPVPKDALLVNVNLDMVGRNDKGELYACGTRPWPGLNPFVEKAKSHPPVKLLMGHDGGEGATGRDDWTSQSDQGAFHAAGIPFLYFGEEDHEDYHRATDEASRIQQDFHRAATETILDVLLAIDAGLGGKRPGAPKEAASK